MKLILTRPHADTVALSARLEAMEHSIVQCPLLEIRPVENVVLPDRPYQAVCASSANGLAARINWDSLINLPFIAVGEQSAAAARQRGFQTVFTAGTGTLRGLADLAITQLKPSAGALLYLSGDVISGDLAVDLQPHGIHVERVIAYAAVALTPLDLKHTMAQADGVLLYSARTARLWLAAVEASQQHDRLKHLTHYCLSPAVAAQLPQSLSISIARTPNDQGMMELLA